jgi:glycosyltransferase involved in cell wall biosynthesis
MTKTRPMAVKISVVTATYNCEATLPETLASLKAQTHLNFEHVVVDGLSTDRTLEIAQANADGRTTTRSEKDRGIYDALNKGIARCTGDVIGFLHADDMYAGSDTLSRVAEALTDPTVSAVYGDLVYVKQKNPSQVVRQWRSCAFNPRLMSLGWMPPHPTLYVRREWYEKIGGFDTRYRIAADYFSILQLFSQPDFKAIYLPQVMVKMRLGGTSNRSIKNMIRKSSEDFDALQRSGLGPIGSLTALVSKNLSKIGQFLA